MTTPEMPVFYKAKYGESATAVRRYLGTSKKTVPRGKEKHEQSSPAGQEELEVDLRPLTQREVLSFPSLLTHHPLLPPRGMQPPPSHTSRSAERYKAETAVVPGFPLVWRRFGDNSSQSIQHRGRPLQKTGYRCTAGLSPGPQASQSPR